jgi:hypothetical protein
MIYDASQDRYLLHGGRPLVSVANQTTSAVERTWAVDPDTLAVTGLTPVAGYPAEAWGRQLVHNVEQNITYAYGGCFDFRFGPSSIGEVCYEPQLRVLLNPGAHPLPLPPYAETPNTGLTTEGQYGVGLFHLTYDPNYDRLLLTGSDAVADPITGVIEYGASAWQLLYQRPLPALPLLSASATALSLGGGGSGSFDLINTAAALGLYRVLPIESWLSVDQPAGYLAAGTSVHVGVTAKTAGLASGVHRGTLRVDGAAKQSFAVTVEVTVP